MDVQEFLKGDLNLKDFYSRFFAELERVNKKYNLLVKISKPPGSKFAREEVAPRWRETSQRPVQRETQIPKGGEALWKGACQEAGD